MRSFGHSGAARWLAAVTLASAWGGATVDAQEPAAAVEAKTPAAASADPREQDVRRLIERYFKSWSSRDLQRYGECFMPQAAVQLLGGDGRLATMPLGPFLKTQKLAHEQAAKPMVETPESIDIRFEAKLARAVVKWKLVDGGRGDQGYDHFTLVETPAGWRIANLIFYSDAPQP